MAKYLLDTDTCIELLKQNQVVLRRYSSCSPDDINVSSMTKAELLYGARNSNNPERGREQVELLLSPLECLSFDSDAASYHAEIRFKLKHNIIGERDIVIASVALSNSLTLVTHNQREFKRIPGLVTEDWIKN